MTPPDSSDEADTAGTDGDPSRDGAPSTETTPPSTAGSSRSAAVRAVFVLQVVIWNAVLLLAALGALLVGVEGRWRIGTTLLGTAGLLAAYGGYRWPDRA